MLHCFTDYIGIDRTSTSGSGLYATDLPGIVLATLEDLTTEDQADYLELWEVIYGRSVSNLITDVSNVLQGKFHVDSKLIARESSEFESGINQNTGIAGVLIEFNLPRYALIHILSVEVYAEPMTGSDIPLTFYDRDVNGEVLLTKTITRTVPDGRNSVAIGVDFNVESLFIGYNTSVEDLRATSDKTYSDTIINSKSCSYCYGDGQYTGTITQVNGGGLNVKYVVYCSVEKFICENLNLFKKSLWWKVGEELAIEMIFGERINRFTTMSAEGADKRLAFFNAQFNKELNEATKSHNITEDLICFKCKNVVESTYSTP
jgi:hypothetical protein